MKMKGLIFVLMTFTQAVFAQNLWKVEYETYDKIFLDEKDANFKAELDKNNSTPKYYALLFDENQSYFSEIERIKNEQNQSSMSMSTITDHIYIDYKNSKYMIEDNYLNKNVLITDHLPTYNWTISRETKQLLGITVRKAMTEHQNSKIEAWFASTLQPKGGPVFFNGLPGLILELKAETMLEDEQYETVFKAIHVKEASKREKIKIPSKGQKMTQKEADDFVKEANRKIVEASGNRVEKD
ncbi:GLPGLI family protein [Empedobacter brevis NBRC 14943 = ATCC 43319]|uniref:GLPGLI family protein n=2 Tax=Empedobacter brevis TaxID=247 RepID=A0A511NHR5_9FLAO|nr:GLPGLI family protein [Empedobacter brevis NBRC 14943 = ATCC 43319]